MEKLRFFVLQVVLAAALTALWLKGLVSDVITGDTLWFVSGVLGAGFIGLILAAFGRTDDAGRVRDLLPVGAVVAMQIGIVVALGVAGHALMAGSEPIKVVGLFFSAVSTALIVSVTALASYIWITVTLWLSYGK